MLGGRNAIWSGDIGEGVVLMEMTKLPVCPWCKQPPTVENCDDPRCDCGAGFVGCLNDACPVQPMIEMEDGPAPDGWNDTERKRQWAKCADTAH